MPDPNREILLYINANPQLQSILYDTDLLPEQTMNQPSWLRTVAMTRIYQEMAGLTDERDRYKGALERGAEQHGSLCVCGYCLALFPDRLKT